MPVLPLVGSTSTVWPGTIVPACSASSTMALAMRSFTEADGLKLSNLARISAWQPQAWGERFNRTRGVPTDQGCDVEQCSRLQLARRTAIKPS